MNSWRDRILSEFTPGAARLTLVADPDGLLLEEGVLAAVRERGFDLLAFDDPVAFRYAYESGFRSRWDRGEGEGLAVVLRFAGGDLDALPHDLLQAGRRLSFSLAELFPGLSPSLPAALDRADLDALYAARQKSGPGVLGENAGKDFVLRHVFDIAPETIEQPPDLLRMLLRRHYRGLRIPALLDERLLQLLRRRGAFADWPLETIVPDREAFFAFLQERWPVFLDRAAGGEGKEPSRRFEFPGPADLPFDHEDVRVYIDNLFVEGFLQAVAHERAAALAETWLALGIRTDERADRKRRLELLLERMGDTAADVPQEDARHGDWFRFAKTWAELVNLALESDRVLPQEARRRMEHLQMRIDAALAPWLAKRYAGLIALPPVPPVMLHHVPRLISRQVAGGGGRKAALVVVDGLALHQWIAVRKELARQRPGLRFRESAVFAWVPTVTSVSRQAVFAGQPPIYFPDSIHATDKERALWMRFWEDQGLKRQEIAYAKGQAAASLQSVEEMLPGTRAAGLVVGTVDEIMHGMKLGIAGMHNQVRQWAAQPFLAELVDLLLTNGFHVWLTSDHGNIEAAGCGRPAEGAAANLRGERARIYADSLLRARVKERFPQALEWPPVGLPEDYLPLLAPGRKAFVRETERVVGHGGASLEELVVPLVRIESRDA